MNTRLQVEHPVTEAITGLDLVAWQFRVAAGEKLPLTQDQVRFDGHAIEARIYAEDPENGFLPSTGTIVGLYLPRDVRVDSGVERGGEVTPFYDAMIAKLIAHAPTRETALDRMVHSLDRTVIAGVRSNVPFLRALCLAPAFRDGKVDTGFIDRNLEALGAVPHEPDYAAAAVAVPRLFEGQSQRDLIEPDSPWSARDGFQLGEARSITVPILVDGETAEAIVAYGKNGADVTVLGEKPATDASVFEAPHEIYVVRHGRQTRIRMQDVSVEAAATGGGDGVIKAPMHGRLLELFVQPGDTVAGGQRLGVIEAMKMEHTLRAPFAGIVASINAAAGEQVVEGAEIMVIERLDAG